MRFLYYYFYSTSISPCSGMSSWSSLFSSSNQSRQRRASENDTTLGKSNSEGGIERRENVRHIFGSCYLGGHTLISKRQTTPGLRLEDPVQRRLGLTTTCTWGHLWVCQFGRCAHAGRFTPAIWQLTLSTNRSHAKWTHTLKATTLGVSGRLGLGAVI